jgi:phospholipid-transporting ATPase
MWTWFNFFSLLVLSIFIYIIYFVISNFFGTLSPRTPLYLLSTPLFYLMVICVIAMVFVFDLTFNQIVRELWTTEIDRMLRFKEKLQMLIHQ